MPVELYIYTSLSLSIISPSFCLCFGSKILPISLGSFIVQTKEQQLMALSIEPLLYHLGQLGFAAQSINLTLLQTEETGQSLPWEGEELPWNGSSCLSVVCYVLKFCSDSEHKDVFETIMTLNDLAREFQIASPYFGSSCISLGPLDAQTLAKRREFAETFVSIFMPKVKEFFVVPKRSGHLPVFIHFLLGILNPQLPYNPCDAHQRQLYSQEFSSLLQTCLRMNSESNDAQYEGPNFAELHRLSMTWIQVTLGNFLVVLGDTPFKFTDMVQVKNVLTEFEAVANDAGSLIYSCFFRIGLVDASVFSKEILDLFQKFDFLHAKINEHCIKFSELTLPIHVNLMKTTAADSHFIVESLLGDLQNFMNSRDDLRDEMKHQTATLHGLLLSVQSFLKDTNVPEETEIQELQIQIRDTAYETEYLLNSYIVGDLYLSYFSLRLPMIIHKFKLIIEGFTKIRTVSGIETLNVQENLTKDVLLLKIVPTSEAVDDNSVFKDVTVEILDKLTGGSLDLEFVCIYGMPGLGKTTLARRLYNHRLITDRFDECAWCVASQTYRMREVLIAMLLSLRSKKFDKEKILEMKDDILVSSLYKTLYSRRYFIVIDDVWDSGVWNDLRRFFRNDRNGSRILFTTRFQDTSPINSLFYALPFLSNDQCWELLKNKVFHGETCPPQLQDSGKRIAAKCSGLPLAVAAIAGTLANMATEKHIWDKVEGSLHTYTGDCMKLLELSFNHLPDHLKLCFLYLGVLSETGIQVQKLIRLWIIEGFVRKDEDRSPEQVGEEYLMDLVNRSLVQVVRTKSTGGVKACSIHDLLREMCIKVAEEENFMNLIQIDHNSINKKQLRIRVCSTSPAYIRPFSLRCRSFFGHLLDPLSCLPQMKRIKVMELTTCPFISHMNIFHEAMPLLLKYLAVDQSVPEPVLYSLVNLEVLIMNNKLGVDDLSEMLSKLVKLKHLLIKYTLFYTVWNSSQPHNLQSLSNVDFWSSDASENLRYIPHLQKLRCQCKKLPDLHFLTELESLKIVARGGNISRSYNQAINFPMTIKKLNLLNLWLSWEMISVLGTLPQLQALKLFRTAFEGNEWKTSDNGFQKLRFLEIRDVEFEQLISTSEHFPILGHLLLVRCNKLQGIPADLGEIDTLHTIEVHDCDYGASMSAIELEQEQCDSGNKSIQVIITNQSFSKEQLFFIYNEGITSTVHFRVICDGCEMSPIVGDRYKCKDCVEGGGYDLCEGCYSSNRSNKLQTAGNENNQKHTSEHVFEILTSHTIPARPSQQLGRSRGVSNFFKAFGES